MKLAVYRSQKDTSEGVRFIVTCRIEFSPDDDRLLTRYGTVGIIEDLTEHAEAPLKEHALVLTFEEELVDAAIQQEERVKRACEDLREYWTTAELYSGHDEFDF